MLKVGILGYGYWGPNITRNFVQLDDCRVKMVADSRQERLNQLKDVHPSIKTSTEVNDVFEDPEIDAIAVVTPVSTHYGFAKRALLSGKHVLVEKPITTNTSEAEELIAIAREKKLTLMVDHTFLYTGSVEKMKEIVDSGQIGNIKYLDGTRINLGLFQQDVNVLWDLASHDISVVNYLIEERPKTIQATGICHTDNDIENIAYLTLKYVSGLIVHLNCSWSSPVKIRQILVGGDKKMIVFNDIEPTEKVNVYDRGYTVIPDDEKKKVLIDYRLGDVTIPKIHLTEALNGVVKDFYNSIKNGAPSRSDSASGLEVVKMLELAEKSLKNNGREYRFSSSQ